MGTFIQIIWKQMMRSEKSEVGDDREGGAFGRVCNR